jgi:hypothetical protein
VGLKERNWELRLKGKILWGLRNLGCTAVLSLRRAFGRTLCTATFGVLWCQTAALIHLGQWFPVLLRLDEAEVLTFLSTSILAGAIQLSLLITVC